MSIGNRANGSHHARALVANYQGAQSEDQLSHPAD
jgi:hypothetical protein